MRVAAMRLGRAAGCMIAIGCMVGAAGPAAAQDSADSAAHALAEKFSHAADAAQDADAAKKAKAERERAAAAQRKALRQRAAAAAARQRASDEADMLARARAEAEARLAQDRRAAAERDRIEAAQEAARADGARVTREAEEQRQQQDRLAEEARQAEAARLAREVEEQRLADELKAEEARQAEVARIAQEAEQKRVAEVRKAEEARQAEAARLAREAEQKRVAEARKAEEARQAEIAHLAREAEQERLAEARKAEETRQAEIAREALEAQRLEQARSIAEKFRLAREARELARETRSSLGGPPPAATDQRAPWDDNSEDVAEAAHTSWPARVTVLLVMEPRQRKFGSTRQTGNPVLCVGEGCYVSGGPDDAADYMRRVQALGPANSIGRRAGPCTNHLVCVFRNVTLASASTWIQPVDMGFWHHDRRDIRTVQPDRTCEVVNGQLFCAAPVVAHRYRAWIVPENIARKAGAGALEAALQHGLPLARSAGRETWAAKVYALPTR